jgi:hypothetical protein
MLARISCQLLAFLLFVTFRKEHFVSQTPAIEDSPLI